MRKLRSLALLTVLASAGSMTATGALSADPAKTRKARSTPSAPSRTNATVPRGNGVETTPSAVARLDEDLKKVLRGRTLHHGTTAVYAVDAETGEVLFATNETKALNPASNVKLFSTATVLDVLGDDFVYKTKLLGPAPNKAGVVAGGAYFLGTGDPTLEFEDIEALVADAVARGVMKIDGDVSISDDLYRDNLAMTGIRIDANGGSKAGKSPSVTYEPHSDFVEVVIKARTVSSRRAKLAASGKLVEKDGVQKWVVTVTGGIRPGASSTLRVGAPLRSTFTAHAVRSGLIDAGIEVSGAIRIEELDDYNKRVVASGAVPSELAAQDSAPMAELVRAVNKYSINHLADRLIMTAAAQETGGSLDMDTAVNSMLSFLDRAGIDRGSLKLDTGSGLSYKTKLTAVQIVDVLRVGAGFADGSRSSGESFLESLSVGGVDGTLRRRLRGGTKGKILGKTGTLTSCLAVSGFVLADNGKTVAFAIVTNGNRPSDRNNVRGEQDRLIEAIHAYAKRAGASE